MDYVLYIFKMTVCVILDAVLLAMFLRVLLSLFGADPNSGLYGLLCLVTEPFILPVRYLLESIEAVRTMPIDLSFFVTYLILNIVSGLLARGI
jgi:uncharacterized protein YggT (Ycf19 family)